MTPETITLTGFRGIRDGLGRDELHLDLRTVAGALIAITGENGRGKTTLLDNLHPYRIMPSRASSYSPAAFSYFDQVGADAQKVLQWTMGGRRYRSTIVLKQTAKTRKQEAYLHVEDADGWAPYTGPDGTVSDGKTSTYDALVEQLLGPAELFFTAAFSAQKRKALSDYTNGEVKALLAELLGHGRIQALGQQANEVARALTVRHAALADPLRRLAAAEERRARAVTELESATADLATQEKALAEARAVAAAAQQDVVDARAAAAADELHQSRRADLQRQLAGRAGAEQRLEQARQQLAEAESMLQAREEAVRLAQAAVTAARARLADAESGREESAARQRKRAELQRQIDEHDRSQEMAEKDRADRIAYAQRQLDDLLRQDAEATASEEVAARALDAQAEAHRATIAREQEITAAVADLPGAEESMAALRARAEEVAREREGISALRAEHQQLESTIQEILRRGTALRERCDDLASRGVLTEQAPCRAGAGDLFTACPFVSDARVAAETLPQVDADRQAALTEYQNAKAKRDQLAAQLEAGADVEARAAAIGADIHSATARVDSLRRLAALADGLAAAREALAAVEQHQAAALKVSAERARRFGANHHDLQIGIAALENLARHEQTEAAARRSQLVERLAEIPADDSSTQTQAEEALGGAEAALRTAEQQHQQLRDQIAQAKAEAGAAEREIAALPAAADIETQLAAVPPPADPGRVPAAERAVTAAETVVRCAGDALQLVRDRITRETAGRDAAQCEIDSLSQVREQHTRLEAEIAHWRLLATALGPNGVIALSIDDAGPTLASLTNDLLAACYGPRFTVRIDTQTTTKAGETREGFDIVVFDADSGSDAPLDAKSGGQQIWIHEALARAIALYQAQNSGHRYECLFSDEADGALSDDKKRQFMTMKRRVMAIGGYRREFFISHTPEITQMADARINMNMAAA